MNHRREFRRAIYGEVDSTENHWRAKARGDGNRRQTGSVRSLPRLSGRDYFRVSE